MKSVLLVCLVACGATPALPAQPTVVAGDAAPLLDAWAAAAGGRDRLARIDRIELTGTLEIGGLTGRFTTWETARGERRHEESLAAIGGSIDVFDGARGWQVDRNHKVRELDGFELADQIALGYLGANAALVPGRRPGQIARDGAGIRIAPAAGRPMSIAFDPATHLPATIARPAADQTRIITLADWRVVDGVRIAFLRKDEDGDPRDTRIYRVETAAIDRGTAGFARPSDPPPDYRFAAGAKAAMPVELASALVFAQVQVNGSPPLAFIVDTGAEVTVINRSRLARLGLAPVGELAIGAGGGNAAMSYVTGVSFALAGVELHDQTVTAVPLDELEAPLHHRIDGILGYDFLSRFVVELDYSHATMTLYDHAAGHRAAGEPVEVTLDGGVPNLAATFDVAGRRLAGRFLVDTGYNGEISFNAPFTRIHRLIESSPRVIEPPRGSRGAGGETSSVTGRIAGFAIGGLQLPSLIASFTRDAGGALADPQSAGQVGGELLRRFVVTFDYDRKTMWLAKAPGADRPSTLITAGIRWAPSPGGFAIEAILAGSAADQAGLAIGDLLISVDGAPAASHTLEQLDELFHRDVAPRAVVVQRGAARLAVTVTPRALL